MLNENIRRNPWSFEDFQCWWLHNLVTLDMLSHTVPGSCWKKATAVIRAWKYTWVFKCISLSLKESTTSSPSSSSHKRNRRSCHCHPQNFPKIGRMSGRGQNTKNIRKNHVFPGLSENNNKKHNMSTECGDSNQDHWSIGQCAALYFDLVGTLSWSVSWLFESTK